MVDSELSPNDETEHIVNFIQDVVEDAGADHAVIGLSGGIDSTTVAHLAVEALGSDGVHGYVLPSDTNRDENMVDAGAVADALSIDYDVFSINDIVDAFEDAVPSHAWNDFAHANLQARIRGTILYLHANANNALVLGTGNRTETYAGYFTKYGDQAVDCNPIGHLYKTEVRELARELGVHEPIIEKPPTAGLWEGQTDEGELGIAYETLDDLFHLLVDENINDPAELVEMVDDVTAEQVAAVLDRYEATQHKRAMPPAPQRRAEN